MGYAVTTELLGTSQTYNLHLSFTKLNCCRKIKKVAKNIVTSGFMLFSCTMFIFWCVVEMCGVWIRVIGLGLRASVQRVDVIVAVTII